ncbi:non-hydrolyzing UDP-N-acetylglucosamine 2-epimerase [Microbacter margulisiae]|uniref:UDP-N-acetylglucosamine 2-epimerase (Non-hydrolyzing) n=1 Tax=Microbacter margulisiae TaxID=1350067 RepID=A0A7W5DRL9_9PORP|nr:UDP-N-acetylglucosamine 2-epimerase (non-hydrolyzing) [Microbacter margulisiae]MBB3187829.1 UDP-N-acetylglucosamine 2-epimerase (non-hydrolyzing) [Microbacter margulisiae]
MKKKILLVVGARPNFMKIAPLMHALQDNPHLEAILVHTGQHYDNQMSGRFFEELGIPAPHINLEVGSASHAQQTARIMMGFEQVCLDEKPDFVLVVGDVNSTAACTLVAAKLNIKSIHYEAGLRSRDRSMPEEINRLVTDAISDYFFTTSVDADDNLLKEGVSADQIFMVGNLMIDTLEANLSKAQSSTQIFPLLNKGEHINIADIAKAGYGVMTFHRPSNVDNKEILTQLVSIWGAISEKIPLVFPIHPRTYKNIQQFGLLDKINQYEHLLLIEPLGYLEFIHLVSNATFALTDSGGIQEETTHLNIPCLTVRPNTERPVTVWEGSNKLIQLNDIEQEINLILQGNGKKGTNPKYWDGKTAQRIVAILETI